MTVGDTARFFPIQQMAYICRGGQNDEPANLWAYNGVGVSPPIQGTSNPRGMNIATGILVGTIPQGSWIHSVEVYVLTAFNAGGNNNLLCGTVNAGTLQASLPATFQNLVAAGDINATVIGNTVSGRGLGPLIALTQDQDVYIQYTQTGTPANQGNAMLLITFTSLMG